MIRPRLAPSQPEALGRGGRGGRGGRRGGRGRRWRGGRGRHFQRVFVPSPVYGYPYGYGYRDQSCPTNVRLSEADLQAVREGQSVRLVGTNQCGQPVDLTVQGFRGSQVGGTVVGGGQSVGGEAPPQYPAPPPPPAPEQPMGDPVVPEQPVGEYSPLSDQPMDGEYSPLPQEAPEPGIGDPAVDPMAEFLPRE